MILQILGYLFGIFTGLVVDIVAGTILAVFIALVADNVIYRLRRRIRSMNQLYIKINVLKGRSKENVDRLALILKNFKDPVFYELWQEYRTYALDEGYTQKADALRNYFNMENIVDIPAKRRRASFATLTLFLTGFLLMLLGIAGSLIYIGDFTPLRSDIVTSLSVLAILAYAFSGIYWVIDRRTYAKAKDILFDINVVLENRIPKFAESDLIKTMIDQNIKSAVAIRDAGAAIGRNLEVFMSEKLIPSVQGEFERALREGITNSLDRITHALDKLAQETSVLQTENMRTMADEFASRVEETVKGFFTGYVANIERLDMMQSKIAMGLTEFYENLTSSVEHQRKINETTSAIADKIYEQSVKATANTQTSSDNIDKLVAYAGQLEVLTDANMKTLEAYNNERTKVQEEVGGYFNKMTAQMISLNEDLHVQVENIFGRFTDISNQTFERYENNTTSVLEMLTTGLSDSFETLNGQILNMGLYAKEINDEIGILNNKLESSVNVFNESIQTTVKTSFENFDAGMAEICTKLGLVISDIKDTVESMPAIVSDLKKELK